jgi:RimJ/RimL family protein N-acetyltransferase/uncharacterized glyoxalase superfamily protein PhnB
MFLKALTPMLKTTSVGETIDFYTSVLAFSVHSTFEDAGILRWCTLKKDNVLIMFSLTDEEVDKPHMTGDLYLYTADVDALWDHVKDGDTIVCEPQVMPYNMKEFLMRDNNGYLLRVGMSVEPTTAFEKWFPRTLTMESGSVQLRILKSSDLPSLSPLTNSDTTWKYFTKDLGGQQAYEDWMKEALSDYANEKRVPFLIFDKKTNKPAGSTSYGNISFYDKRIEIGWSWLGDEFKGTGVNTHAKFLLLQYAFETLQFERVEVKTDNLNERAKAALLKIGAASEGVLRSHMQMHSNRRRDSIYFAILKNEWEQVKKERFAEIK